MRKILMELPQNKMIQYIYKKIIKPILFKFSADDVHAFFLNRGRLIGKFKIVKYIFAKIFNFKNSLLNQKILGINFENPVGLSAGFDYDADLIDILPSLGFGFHTIGTVTNESYEGNPRPMLGRLPKSKSLLVNKGFKSMGMESVLVKIRNRRYNSIPLGISIGATNKPYGTINEMAIDVVDSFSKVLKVNYFDYYELNISCPNLINSQCLTEKFDDPIGFDILLSNLDKLNIIKPVFLKMHAEKSIEETLALAEVANNYSWLQGIILSNLVKNRENKFFDREEILNAGKGNFSGKPVDELSNNLINAVYKKFKNRFIIIGVGGIFSGEDAYKKIKLGASLVQLITGMVYNGPSLIGNINQDIVKLLKKDGYKTLKDAVGTKNI